MEIALCLSLPLTRVVEVAVAEETEVKTVVGLTVVKGAGVVEIEVEALIVEVAELA